MKKDRVRALALCVPRRQPRDEIFVARGYDRLARVQFYRPLGGGIDFGEHSAQAAQREMLEEIGHAVADVRYVGTLENIFVFEGAPGHEIVMVYDARFADEAMQRLTEPITRLDNPAQEALWVSLDALDAPLYPPGLDALLKAAPR
jgi:8-oxo-dGTP pyrophosphatase MutT (NUDIX family)